MPDGFRETDPLRRAVVVPVVERHARLRLSHPAGGGGAVRHARRAAARLRLEPRGLLPHIGLYLVLYAFVFPLCWLMAHTKDFQRIYPFYRLANRSLFEFVAWELLYAAQFLSLEFFFRGFMLSRPSARGVHAIWVMVVPYCMIHFGKTFAETMAAIVAGLALGTVALRTSRSGGGSSSTSPWP
jgi:hypothetical protein